MNQFKDKIRNFVIISHIDHGKSTLADRFLELTKTIPSEKMRSQYLDQMDLEREKGITVKMHPVRMLYEHRQNQKSKIKNQKENKEFYILNLIDTPGHVDFNYEVSRSLAAVEGAILLIDVTKGIQAQTIGNLELAKKQNLVIIPAINKIDLINSEPNSQARLSEVEQEISKLLNVKPEEIIKISAKKGINIEELLEKVVEKIPPPKITGDSASDDLRALIFDSKYDPYQGVLAFVRIFQGKVKRGEKIYLLQSKAEGKVKEVGIFKPQLSTTDELGPGEIGFVATGIKESVKVRVGDTLSNNPENQPLPGYQKARPKVFLSIYPQDDTFESLKLALEKLRLMDSSLYFKPEFKGGLGRGFQCGFLGLLHAEIVAERLKREFGLNIILSTPSVIYKILTADNEEKFIYTASDWPETGQALLAKELWIRLQILTPSDYFGKTTELLSAMEVKHQTINYFGPNKVELIYEMPLREMINKNLYDRLKSATQGFASMNYQLLDWRPVELVKLDILILGQKEEAFSRIVPKEEAYSEGKKIVEKLKENLPAQLFALPIQAAVGGKIIARETIKAKRRDVIAPLYGGDYTRKRKLLEKQKKGKKELLAKTSAKEKGRIRIPPKVFLEIFKK